MTDRDVLDEALAAFREHTESSGEERAVATRRELLARAMTRRRRFTIVRVVLPFAALLGVGAAWAARTDRAPRWFGADAEVVRSAARATSTPVATGVTAPREAPPAPESASASAASAAPTAVAAMPAAKAVAPDESLYRAAHEAHFVAHDWPRALAGWDAYLREAPKGRFAPEARYNRALVLVRLGRHDEARRALAPFADGSFGGYRQTEAKEILDALQ